MPKTNRIFKENAQGFVQTYFNPPKSNFGDAYIISITSNQREYTKILLPPPSPVYQREIMVYVQQTNPHKILCPTPPVLQIYCHYFSRSMKGKNSLKL